MSDDLQNVLNVFSESRFFLQARPCKRPLVGIPYCSIEFNSTIQRTDRQTVRFPYRGIALEDKRMLKINKKQI